MRSLFNDLFWFFGVVRCRRTIVSRAYSLIGVLWFLSSIQFSAVKAPHFKYLCHTNTNAKHLAEASSVNCRWTQTKHQWTRVSGSVTIALAECVCVQMGARERKREREVRVNCMRSFFLLIGWRKAAKHPNSLD